MGAAWLGVAAGHSVALTPGAPCRRAHPPPRQDVGTAVTPLLWARPVALDKPPGRGSRQPAGEPVPGAWPTTSGATPSPRRPADCSPAPRRLETAYTARRPLAASEPQESAERGKTGEASWEGPWGRRGFTHLAAASAHLPAVSQARGAQIGGPCSIKGTLGQRPAPHILQAPCPSVCGSFLGGRCPL